MSKYEYVGYTLMACVLTVVCWSHETHILLNLGLIWAGVNAGVLLTGLLNKED